MKKMKCAAMDYTESDLPATRKEMFAECYREHFNVIFRLGLVCFAILLPTFFVMILRDNFILAASESVENLTQEQLVAIYYNADMVYGLIKIFTFTLAGALFAGVMQVVRQLLWNEPIFFGDDFKNGLKSNALRYGVTAFLLAGTNYLLRLAGDSLLTYIVHGIFLFMILPVAVWFALQSLYYKLGIVAGVKNALLFYLKTVPLTILLLAGTVAPFELVNNLINLVIVKYGVLLVLTLFYILPIAMAWVLYATHIFDKYVNREHYPTLYRKGMSREADEDSEEYEENSEADEETEEYEEEEQERDASDLSESEID